MISLSISREKGKPPEPKGKREKVEDHLLGSFPLGNGHWAYTHTNETKRFPGTVRAFPPTSDVNALKPTQSLFESEKLIGFFSYTLSYIKINDAACHETNCTSEPFKNET